MGVFLWARYPCSAAGIGLGVVGNEEERRGGTAVLQGYLAHKKQPPPRILQYRCSGQGGCVGGLQGYLAHKKPPPPWDQNRSLGIGLLWGPTGGGGHMSEKPL